ncbi:MAG: hypothetical protein K9H64_18065 [Bacteroidales bacterium]|nr:hypothetical protein [Bacteroidales bacterium]MCF8457904.1 hypothetical protein [Bacteroidales bacterium]
MLLLISSNTTLYAQPNVKAQALNLFGQGNYQGAITLLEPLHQRFPKDPEINFYFGACMVENRSDFQKAVKFLTEASLSHDFVQSYFYLGKAYLLEYQFDKATQHFQRFQNQADKKRLKSYDAGLYLKACENGKQIIKQVSEIDSRNIVKVAFSDLPQQLENSTTGSVQMLDESLKSKADNKLPQGFSIIQSKLKEEVYFASYGKNDKNGQDLVFNFKDEKDKWNKTKSLSDALLSSYNEINPVISPNGKDIYFCSNGEGSMGGYDVFKSSFNSEKQEWSKPTNLGFPINTPFDDFLFIPDFENNTALLATNRECSPDSAWLFILDLTSIHEVGTISNYSTYSLFAEQKELEIAASIPAFTFPVPNQQAKSSFTLLQEEANQDEKLMGDYLEFLAIEIESCTNIGDFKQKASLKKKKEASDLKASANFQTDSTDRIKVEELSRDAERLIAEAEFTYSYINQLKRFQKKITELKKQASDFNNELKADGDVFLQWQKLKENRTFYNQYSVVFVPIEQEIQVKQDEFTRKEELNISKKDLETSKLAISHIEKKLALNLYLIGSSSGEDKDQLYKEISELEKSLEKNKIKLQFLESANSDLQAQFDAYADFLKNLRILNEALIYKRGRGFDFSVYYLQPEKEPSENTPVTDTKDGSDLEYVYDFSGLTEQKVLSKIQLNKNEQKVFEKAIKFEKKAGKQELEIQKLQDALNDYEFALKDAKGTKRKKIRKKQRKTSEEIDGHQVKAYTFRVNSVGLKYPILEGRLNSLKAESNLDSDQAKQIEETSKSNWKEGNSQWAKAEKSKAKKTDGHTEAFRQIDSSYTGLLNTLAFYLDLLPQPTIPKPEIEAEPELKIEAEPIIEIEPEPEIIPVEVTIEDGIDSETSEEAPEKLDVWYSVQLGLYKTDKIPAELDVIPDINVMHEPNGLYRYSSGKFDIEHEATTYKGGLKNAGYDDAFVVAYRGNERISLEQARKLIEEGDGGKAALSTSEVKELPAQNESFYTVQIGVFRNNPDFSKLPVKDQLFNSKLPSGLTKYTYGQFADHSEALSAQATIRQTGIRDAFVLKVEPGSLASVSPAKNNTPDVPKQTVQNSEIKDISTHQGLFYSVQIGVYKEAQQAGRFKGVGPLYYHRADKYYKYYTGIFSTIEEVVSARNRIRLTVIPDAFVVAFYKGEKISISRAKELSKNSTSEKEPQQKIVVDKVQTENPNVDNLVKTKKTTEARELFYTIQIGVFSSKLTDLSKIRVEPLYQFAAGAGKYRLTCGHYGDYQKAVAGKETAISAGYPDAYIIAYCQGENISLNEAARLSANDESIIFAEEKKVKIRMGITPSPKRSKNNEIEYRIQIATFKDPASTELATSYIELAGTYGLSDFVDSNGMTVYTVGKFSTYSEAMKARKLLIENDAPGAFIIAFRGKDKIPVNEAIQITERD